MTQRMRRMGVAALMVVAALGATAQDEVLDRYVDNDEVQKTTVTPDMLDSMPAEAMGNLELPVVKMMKDRIKSLRLFSSDKPKAEKQLRVKVPKELEKQGFVTVLQSDMNGSSVRMMRYRDDLTRLVLIVTSGKKTTVVSMKGSFD